MNNLNNQVKNNNIIGDFVGELANETIAGATQYGLEVATDKAIETSSNWFENLLDGIFGNLDLDLDFDFDLAEIPIVGVIVMGIAAIGLVIAGIVILIKKLRKK